VLAPSYAVELGNTPSRHGIVQGLNTVTGGLPLRLNSTAPVFLRIFDIVARQCPTPPEQSMPGVPMAGDQLGETVMKLAGSPPTQLMASTIAVQVFPSLLEEGGVRRTLVPAPSQSSPVFEAPGETVTG